MNRDFKGVWIPKEIWLDKELDLTEKALLIEIHSLDNEFHCVAGNDYFAEFLNCSESTITRAIKHLKELGYIASSFDGRVRKLRVVKLTRQSSQIDEHNNIYNNTHTIETINIVSTPESDQEFLVQETSQQKSKKKNLWESCYFEICEFTEDIEVRDMLRDYLNMRLEVSNKKFGSKTFKGMLKKLRTLTDSKSECLQIIQQAIDRQYLTFYPIVQYNNKRGAKNVETISQGDRYAVSADEKEEMRRLAESGELEEY